MTKEDFKRAIRAVSGHLADKAKLDEYAELMAKKASRRLDKTAIPRLINMDKYPRRGMNLYPYK